MNRLKLIILCASLIATSCLKITGPDFGEELNDTDGTSLVINPLELTVSQGKTFKIRIYLKDAVNVLGLYSQIKFDKNFVIYQRSETVTDANSGIELNGASQVLFVDQNDSGDTLSVNLGFPGGSANGISGTGDVFYLIFKANRTGTAWIDILPGARLTDKDLNEIEITQVKGTTVHVE